MRMKKAYMGMTCLCCDCQIMKMRMKTAQYKRVGISIGAATGGSGGWACDRGGDGEIGYRNGVQGQETLICISA